MSLGTTVDALVQRVRRDALISSRGPVYTLASNYTAGGTSLVVNEELTHVSMGAVVAVEYELFYVQSVSTATKTLAVIPGYFGTTQANHSQNAIVEIDARIPSCMVLDYAEMEIRSWGSELFKVTSVDISVTTNERTYDLGIPAGQEVYFILDARTKPAAGGSVDSWWNFSWVGDAWPRANARLVRGMAASEFASGHAVQFNHPPHRASTVRVAVGQPLDLSPFTSSTDLVADVGLKPDWFDIVEYGCRWRALQNLVVGRTDWRRGSMSRESEEVSTLDVIRAAREAADMRTLRFTKAAVDLRGDWPYREVFG